jgi:hypothetical protein
MTERKNYLDDVEARLAVLVNDWDDGMNDREDVPPQGSTRVSDEDLFNGMIAKYPPELLQMDDGQDPVFMSPYELWLITDDRLTNRKEMMRRIRRGREKVDGNN